MQDTARGSALYLTTVCLVATLGGLLFGYDTGVIAGAVGFLREHFQLTPAMKGWTTSCALAGCVFGVVLAGPLSDRYGRRATLVVAAILFLVSAIGTALPRSFSTFIVFRMIGGLGVGAASMTSPMYIAEISPARIRGRMVSLNQLAIVVGFLVVYFVNWYVATYGSARGDDWNVVEGWRWMFGSEAVPAVLLLVLLLFVPESPRWLTEKRRTDEARRILTRVNGSSLAAREMATIETALAEEPGSLSQLLEPGMRKVLIVGVLLAVLQQVTGINVFLYYAPEIFKGIAGAGVDAAMLQTVVVGAVNLLFTLVAIWTVDRVGRRPLMIIGATGMGVALTAIGLAAFVGRTDVWVLAFILAYIGCFASTLR